MRVFFNLQTMTPESWLRSFSTSARASRILASIFTLPEPANGDVDRLLVLYYIVLMPMS